MGNNKIITSQGNVQFINSKGRTIEMHPMHCYAIFENDTVSFLFINMKEYSGQAFFASQFEDVEVNGETYDSIEALKDAITEAFAKAGAQARTEIVETLPQTGLTNTIYLVPKAEGVGYDEYIYTEDGQWELIGDTDIELDRYLQKADFNVYSASTDEYIASVSANTVQNASDIASISGSLDTEISAREAADSVISGAVDNVSASLANEASRATSAETALGGRIDTVNGRVNDEQTARAQADAALQTAIDAKLDASAYTPTDLSQYWTSAQTESAITEAVSGKQDTLIAGEHITISGNVISAEAGTVPYDGYSKVEIFTGNTWGLDKIDTPFYVVSGSHFSFQYSGESSSVYDNATLDWTNHTSTFNRQGTEDYVSVTWNAKYNAFKFDTLQEGHNITFVGGMNNWGYGVDIVPSGTTNETFDNVIEYMIDSDKALDSKFGNYLTISGASNTYLAKADSAAIKYSQDMFESGQTNISGIVAIQNGFEHYTIGNPLGDYSYPSSYGKGILRESFVLGMADALSIVLWKDDEHTQTWVFGIPQAEVFNGGLVGRKVFVIWDGGYTSAIYFKCENATITTAETQIDFSLSGKIYYDEECTKQYKTRPNWSVQGSVTKDGEVNGYFSAMQLEMDGFFGNKTQNQGVFYDENGNTHQIPSNFNTYSTEGGVHNQGLTVYTYCLVNENISGNYYPYVLNGSLVSNQSKRFGYLESFLNHDIYMNINVSLVDYTKLTPIGFDYVVNDDSTDNQGTVGVKYKKYDQIQTSGGYDVIINGQAYNLIEYSESEGDLVYNDESVSGVYTITVDGDGYRTLMVSDIEGHHSIQSSWNKGGVEIPTYYYVHYTNGTSQEGITSGEVQTMIDESISGKVNTSSVVSSVTSASTDSEIPTAKAVYDAIPTGGTSGGKAISAGTNISITTGETADTVNCILPISIKTITHQFTSPTVILGLGEGANLSPSTITGMEGNIICGKGATIRSEDAKYNFIGGYNNDSFGRYNVIFGSANSALKNSTFIAADGAITKNSYETSLGNYPVSVSASTTFGNSGNTLMSVGNGKWGSVYHNAFEIRQNGDIYIADTNDTSTSNYYEKPMIKLQDALGGGGSITIDPSLDSGSTNAVANSAITTAIDAKVDTSAITTSITSASTDSEIPTAKAVYDAVGQGGGGGGESCTVDSTTIFYSFSERYSNDSLDMKARYVVLDYAQDKTEASNVSVEVNFRDDNYNTYVNQQISLDYTTSSYTLGDISQAEYIDVTYDETIEDFKIAVATAYTSTVFVGYISDFLNGNIKVPFYTISSGSPCTVIENDIPTAISELSDSMFKGLKQFTIGSQQDSISTYTETLGGDGKSSKIKLDEIDGSNSTLKPAIYVGLGTSGWTEINISQQCNIGSLKATKYRVTYNYSEFDASFMGLQLIVEYAGNESYDYVNFDETQQPSLQTSDVFSAATVDWNASTKELVITYPTTIELYGIQESVNISQIYSNNCQFGQTITKLESYGEEKQALKSYVQQNRAALGGLKFVKLSQQEYDGLTTKDANTVYFVGDSNGYIMKIGDVNVS